MHFNPTTKCNTTNEEDENPDENSINNEQQQDDEILRINETPIPEVSSTKFLGVTIDNRLSWTPHIQGNKNLNLHFSTLYIHNM